MKNYWLTLRPATAFGTRLRGDTLFGQFCWAVVEHAGDARLRELLDGYLAGRPFLVVGDPCPPGRLPRPALPAFCWEVAATERKDFKRRVWLDRKALTRPARNWKDFLCDDRLLQVVSRHHNSINPETGTTGGDGYAPFALEGYEYTAELEIPLVADDRLAPAEIHAYFAALGACGYGADASAGLGKFTVGDLREAAFPVPAGANAWLTLGPCAPEAAELDPERCFYKTFTRFGRHGNLGALAAQPFKNPVLLLETGAVLSPRGALPSRAVCGRGLDGIAAVAPAVQQGYAPIVPFVMEIPDA